MVLPYLLENAALVGTTKLSNILRDASANYEGPELLIRLFLAGNITVAAMMSIQHIIVDVIYRDIPYFSGSKERNPDKPVTISECVNDYLTGFLPASISTSLASAALILYVQDPKDRAAAARKNPSAAAALLRLILFRIVSDIFFFLYHYALHNKYLYFLHARHHQHKKTNIMTNYHFNFIDLFMEGFAPGFSAVILFAAIAGAAKEMKNESLREFFSPSALEVSYYVTMATWFEIGSHAGKEIPNFSTVVPPISIIYNTLFPGVFDHHNVLFHERHHNNIKCNYGISTWIDRLVGTAEYRPLDEVLAESQKKKN